MSFIGKKILVTGGGAGIGRGIVKTLAGRGADVFVISRSQDKLDSLQTECSNNVVTKALDITQYDAVRDYILNMKRQYIQIENKSKIRM